MGRLVDAPVARNGIAAAAIALAAIGQGVTSRNFDSHLGWLSSIAAYFRDVYPAHTKSVVLSALLLLLSAALFAFGMRERATDGERFVPLPQSHAELRSRGRHLTALRLLIAGGGLWSYVIWRLYDNDFEGGTLPWMFALSVLLVGTAIFIGRWSTRVRREGPLDGWAVAILITAVAFFLVVNIRDLDSWKYAAIGDEYPFFDYSRYIEAGNFGEVNIFSQLGVWQQRPVGTSVVQALAMRVFGSDTFGWRMATPIVLAAAIPAVYVLARELFDRTVAAFAALVFATSHYLISYAHTAYDNIFAITPFAWCLALAVVGLRRSSATWMYAAGIAGGLGFYTFPTARMSPIVLALFIGTLGRPAWRPVLILSLGTGLLMTALPLFASDGWDAISVSQDRTVFGFTDSPNEGVSVRLLENIPRSLLAWNYNPSPVHFASGTLVDPVTAVFLVLGLGFGLCRSGRPAYRLLAVWLAVTVLFTGIFSPYDRVAVDRIHLALPVVAIYAAIGIATIGDWVASFMPAGRILQRQVALGMFVALTPLIVYLNLHRFLVESPDAVSTTEERIVLGGLQSSACRGSANTLLVIRSPDQLLKPALAAHGYNRPIETRATPDAQSAADFDAYDCVVVTRLKHPSADELAGAYPSCHVSCWHEAQTTIERLEQDYGFKQRASVWTPTAHFEAVVLTRR